MSSSEALKDAMNLNSKILCRRNGVSKTIERIQIGVIETLQQMCLRESIELSQIADHSGLRIYLAAKRDLHGVVVSVAVRIVAFPEHHNVLRSIVALRVQPVRRAEMIAA